MEGDDIDFSGIDEVGREFDWYFVDMYDACYVRDSGHTERLLTGELSYIQIGRMCSSIPSFSIRVVATIWQLNPIHHVHNEHSKSPGEP